MSAVEERLGFLGSRARLLRDAFSRHQVEYMFIDNLAAIAVGLNATTKDLHIFPSKTIENRARLVAALDELKFVMQFMFKGRPVDLREQLLEGRDFVQLVEPFDLDVVYSPDGFESYEDACEFRIVLDGYPLLSIDGIIQSKAAAGRDRDKADLPLLMQFRDWWHDQE